MKEVGPRTQGWIKSIPDLLVAYCLLLGRVNDYTHLCGLHGFYICIFLRSVASDHLLYVQYVLAVLYTISLLEFKDRAITSCLLNIIPPLKKKKNPTRTEHAMFQSGPSGFFSESKPCVFYTRAFSPPQGVSSILLWLSLRRKGLQTTN